jgi:predicted RND superfamily exporter protein
MMTISTALGMSVDNELHFFAWLRQYLQRGMSRHDALMAAYAHCGNVMEHTAVICAAGMLMFALSPFVPVAHFGWIMFVLIMIAVVCDMVLLPALVASPIGSGFGRAKAVSIASNSVLGLQREADKA